MCQNSFGIRTWIYIPKTVETFSFHELKNMFSVVIIKTFFNLLFPVYVKLDYKHPNLI